MEMLIFMTWVILVFLLPVSYIVTAYIAQMQEKNIGIIIGGVFLAFFVHIILTVIYLQLMFIMVFAGAHTEPVGNALDTRGRLLYCGLVAFYAFSGWCFCSLIYQRFIFPRKIFSRRLK